MMSGPIRDWTDVRPGQFKSNEATDFDLELCLNSHDHSRVDIQSSTWSKFKNIGLKPELATREIKLLKLVNASLFMTNDCQAR